jgi:Fur family zinc uptake transcriptional regulator
MDLVGFEEHNHAACAAGMIATAEAYCGDKGLQFTPTRRRVLELLVEEHRALGAYDILQHLGKEGLGSQPSVAYRALDFLLAHGFAHKIERLNAYVACVHPLETHAPAFMICRACDTVVEASSPPSRGMLGRAAREAGFKIEKTVVEAEGLCPHCVAAGAV